jgi:hypothetical protein
MAMRVRHTRRTDETLRGDTVQKSFRIPRGLLGAVEEDIAYGIPEVHTLIDAVTDALWVWHYENVRDRRTASWHEPERLPAADVVNVEGDLASVEAVPNGVTHERPTFADVDLDKLDEPDPALEA